jgi:hypothetical protein
MTLVEPRSTAIHDGSIAAVDDQRVVRSPSNANLAASPAFCSVLSNAGMSSARFGPLPPLTVTTAPLLVTVPEPLVTTTV